MTDSSSGLSAFPTHDGTAKLIKVIQDGPLSGKKVRRLIKKKGADAAVLVGHLSLIEIALKHHGEGPVSDRTLHAIAELLSGGADPDHGRVVCRAVRCHDYALVDLLLDNHADLKGLCLLHMIAESDHQPAAEKLRLVRQLIDHDPAIVKEVDTHGRHPLSCFCRHPLPEAWLQEALLDLHYQNGAKTDTPDSDGYRPLHHAMHTGDKTTVRWLCGKTNDIDARASRVTALKLGALNGLPTKLLRVLLVHGASPSEATLRAGRALRSEEWERRVTRAYLDYLNKNVPRLVIENINRTLRALRSPFASREWRRSFPRASLPAEMVTHILQFAAHPRPIPIADERLASRINTAVGHYCALTAKLIAKRGNGENVGPMRCFMVGGRRLGVCEVVSRAIKDEARLYQCDWRPSASTTVFPWQHLEGLHLSGDDLEHEMFESLGLE
ncbi:unnamed protein product [Vitrella brassicaformis CCMP3155]|uniref:Uncharacterized protein n=2 Tax=Vitrella brassicaformis TaxID=1169539 RepID=A0A0G4G610_VITBC|nr:unnamed protein product [Vitrella brassicaformis CCMP3155]|mmetsp:Transcript_14328/g.41186  ORF Transcript_14328/g.41186 Transcript_14328/m.41186 type:complete len:441 (-) Transcript_14328:242-1564(-)|eukprot:CEM23844.1 unnamed protein product [Vitrella brassicaformis CCMP3155]